MSKTAQQHINEYIASKIETVIDIAGIWSRNIPNTKRVKLQVIKQGNKYYYKAFNGNKSTPYNSIEQAKLDILDCWGNWIDFKFVI